MSEQAVVKIAPELLTAIDEVAESARDEFGVRRFKSRKDVVDEAVRNFLRSQKKELKTRA